MLGARIKIMWEEQLVDPPNDFIVVKIWKAVYGSTSFHLICFQIQTILY